MRGLRTAQVMSKFNKPLFDVSLWVVNKDSRVSYVGSECSGLGFIYLYIELSFYYD